MKYLAHRCTLIKPNFHSNTATHTEWTISWPCYLSLLYFLVEQMHLWPPLPSSPLLSCSLSPLFSSAGRTRGCFAPLISTVVADVGELSLSYSWVNDPAPSLLLLLLHLLNPISCHFEVTGVKGKGKDTERLFTFGLTIHPEWSDHKWTALSLSIHLRN